MLAIRGPFAAFTGALVAVALFFCLAQLVSVPFEAQPLKEASRINFTRQILSTEPVVRRPPKVQLEPPKVEPRAPRIGGPVDEGEVGPGSFGKPIHRTVVTRGGGLPLHGIDSDVFPRVRVEPDYPPPAIARGIEGWVQVRFTVTAIGSVRDAVVVASEPGTIFDDAALKAIARWRYNPRVVNGEAVERVGLQTVFRFELGN
jgi:protein TonB